MNTTQNKARTQYPGHILGGIGGRGIIFSIDALIAFSIMLTCVLVFVFATSSNAQTAEQNTKNFKLEEKALLIADSLVKNYDENNTTLGACIYDADKKRVRTNEISLENLKKAKPAKFGKFFVGSISFENKMQKETLNLAGTNSSECISAKRFALIDGEKSVIFIKTCEEG